MKYLKEADSATIKTIDAEVKNKWSWRWTKEVITRDLGKAGVVKYSLGDCFSKVDVPGAVYCNWCEEKMLYGGVGKNRLIVHCTSTKHIKQLETRATNYRLSSSFSCTPSEQLHFAVFW